VSHENPVVPECRDPELRNRAAAPAQGQTSLAPLYSALQWRELGPFRGGWSTMAAGVPSEPNVFYFGGADGGVWKTTDAGLTWQPLLQHAGSISVGALAIAPSNPKIIMSAPARWPCATTWWMATACTARRTAANLEAHRS